MSNDWAEEKAIDCDKFYKVDRLEAIANALREAHQRGREEGLREMQERAASAVENIVRFVGEFGSINDYVGEEAAEIIRDLPIDGAALAEGGEGE